MPQSEDDMKEARRTLTKQIFQLSYFGKVDAQYASTLEISERNYMYDLLKEQLDAEEKNTAQESQKANRNIAALRSKINSVKRR